MAVQQPHSLDENLRPLRGHRPSPVMFVRWVPKALSLLVVVLAFLLSCSVVERPSPLFEGPLLTLSHYPGMGHTVGRWYKLFHPRSRMPEDWSFQLYPDARVEMSRRTCKHEHVWSEAHRLSSKDFERLLALVEPLRELEPETYRICCDDVPGDIVKLHDMGAPFEVQLEYQAGHPAAGSGQRAIADVFAFVRSRYEPPTWPICRW